MTMVFVVSAFLLLISSFAMNCCCCYSGCHRHYLCYGFSEYDDYFPMITSTITTSLLVQKSLQSYSHTEDRRQTSKSYSVALSILTLTSIRFIAIVVLLSVVYHLNRPVVRQVSVVLVVWLVLLRRHFELRVLLNIENPPPLNPNPNSFASQPLTASNKVASYTYLYIIIYTHTHNCLCISLSLFILRHTYIDPYMQK